MSSNRATQDDEAGYFPILSIFIKIKIYHSAHIKPRAIPQCIFCGFILKENIFETLSHTSFQINFGQIILHKATKFLIN